MSSTEPRSAVLQCTVAEDVHDRFAAHAADRGLSTAGLLRLLTESFIATMAIPDSPLARLSQPAAHPPHQRVAVSLARRVISAGVMTRGQAWRSLSGHDRGRGQQLLDEALAFGVQHDLFCVRDVDGKQLIAPTMTRAASRR